MAIVAKDQEPAVVYQKEQKTELPSVGVVLIGTGWPIALPS